MGRLWKWWMSIWMTYSERWDTASSWIKSCTFIVSWRNWLTFPLAILLRTSVCNRLQLYWRKTITYVSEIAYATGYTNLSHFPALSARNMECRRKSIWTSTDNIILRTEDTKIPWRLSERQVRIPFQNELRDEKKLYYFYIVIGSCIASTNRYPYPATSQSHPRYLT